MAVRVQKSAVNIREKLAELERPIGVNGAALMKTETPQEAFSLIGAGRKNMIINGDHSVNQRGLLPVTGTTTSGYQATDRWKIYRDVITADASISSVTLPNGITTNALKATATSSSATGIFDWYQPIEDKNYNSLKGQWVTLSGWIRSNNPNAKLFLWGGSASRQGYASHSGNGQWQYLSFSCVVSTSINALEPYAAIGNATNLGGVQINSGDYIEFALMQLEVGKVATPFEQRSFGEELALCSRYYQKSYPYEIVPGANCTTNGLAFAGMVGRTGLSGVTTSGEVFLGTKLYPTMRATPSITFYDRSGNVSKVTGTNYLVQDVENLTASLKDSCSTGFQVGIYNVGTFGGISYHYTASAEL